jgi:YegS/Rv2252/BmrU family lipid kinase
MVEGELLAEPGAARAPAVRYHVILNVHSGAAEALGLTGDDLRQRFAAAGLEAVVDDGDEALERRIAKAVATEAEVIVAAGGDGTVTAVAAALVDSGRALAVLPLGTANLLARDLGVPLALDAWVAQLPTMQARRIDVGEVNGTIFLHKVVIGFVPAIASARETIRGRADIGAAIGFLMYVLRRVVRSRRIALAIAPGEGNARVERVQAVAVANNEYDEGFGQVFARHRLDRGVLGLYVLRHLNLIEFFRLSLGMLMGHWRADTALSIEEAKSVTIQCKKTALKVMLDGEVMMMESPFEFRIRPGALTVLAPPAAEAAEGGA